MRAPIERWGVVAVAAVALGVGSWGVRAGNLESPAAPSDPGSAMYTLEDVWNLIKDGIWPTKRAGAFAEPGAAPGSTGHTLDQLLVLVSTRAPAARTGPTPRR